MAGIGDTLRTAREARGLSIEQVARDTRISARFLEALEREQFHVLPAPVYVRGFMRSYASYLRLDPAPLVAQLNLEGGPPAARAQPPSAVGPPATLIHGPAERPRASDPFRRTMPPPGDGAREADSEPRAGQRTLTPRRVVPAEREPEYEPAALPEESDPAPLPPRQPPRTAPVFRTSSPPPRAVPPPPPEEFAREPEDDERFGVAFPIPGPAAVGGPPSQGSPRVLAIAAGGLILLLGAVGLGVWLTSRGDDGNSAAGDDTPAATSQPRTPTVVGRTATIAGTSGSPSPSASPGSPAATGSVTGTPTGVPTATPTRGIGGNPTNEPQPTATPSGSGTPTPTGTATTTPTATPTSGTPTATPTITNTPRPTPTPNIQHPSGFQECTSNGGNCGDPPIRVVCPPDGDWFIDVPAVGGVFPLPPGWREVFVQRPQQAETAC